LFVCFHALPFLLLFQFVRPGIVYPGEGGVQGMEQTAQVREGNIALKNYG